MFACDACMQAYCELHCVYKVIASIYDCMYENKLTGTLAMYVSMHAFT